MLNVQHWGARLFCSSVSLIMYSTDILHFVKNLLIINLQNLFQVR